MYVRPISTRLLRGMFTPAMRAKAVPLPLSLLVSRVLADDEDPPVPADDLALLAHRLHRRSYLHGPFRRVLVQWRGSGRRGGCRYHATERTHANRPQHARGITIAN